MAVESSPSSPSSKIVAELKSMDKISRSSWVHACLNFLLTDGSYPEQDIWLIGALAMAVDRECSNCGEKGHNVRTCTAERKAAIMLFGVKIEQPILDEEKSVYQRKGVPWTEAEHAAFLRGLKELGRGEWKNISKIYVVTRSPSQVASHAQKYFIRQSSLRPCKRRKSIFDQEVDHNV